MNRQKTGQDTAALGLKQAPPSRLRALRRARGLTLAQVAAAIGTTPQTVSRLETAGMSLSADWLERFADLFGVSIAHLLEARAGAELADLGRLDAQGNAPEPNDPMALPFTLPSPDPIAVRLSETIGAYRAGDTLIGARLQGAEMADCTGHDCLVGLDGRIVLARLLAGAKPKRFDLVPLASGQAALRNREIEWAARISLQLRRH